MLGANGGGGDSLPSLVEVPLSCYSVELQEAVRAVTAKALQEAGKICSRTADRENGLPGSCRFWAEQLTVSGFSC